MQKKVWGDLTPRKDVAAGLLRKLETMARF